MEHRSMNEPNATERGVSTEAAAKDAAGHEAPAQAGARGAPAGVAGADAGARAGLARATAPVVRATAPVVELLTHERSARWFFGAHLQSALGTGAGYVALLVLAYDRVRSPWMVALVLLADFAPAMLLGPLFGALADRWPRRRCAVLADLARAVAFLGIALVDGPAATIAFALLAGAGTGLFLPAVMAGIPGMVAPGRVAPATSLADAITGLGLTAGPAIAALAFLVAGPEPLLIVNAATFAVSALVLARVDFGDARRRREATGSARPPGLLAETRDGLHAVRRMRGVRVVLVASATAVLFGAAVNLGELILATDAFGAGPTGYALLVVAYGTGTMLGSLGGVGGGDVSRLRRRFLLGLAVEAGAIVASGASPGVLLAVGTFVLTGWGSGVAIVHERLIIQRTVPDELRGRVFGARDALNAWAFGGAFVAAGAVTSALGPRALFLLAGGAGLAVWCVTAAILRREQPGGRDASRAPADARLAAQRGT
jgi:MFS family permease